MDHSKLMPGVRPEMMWPGQSHHQANGGVSVAASFYPGVVNVGGHPAQEYNSLGVYPSGGPNGFAMGNHASSVSSYFDQKGQITKLSQLHSSYVAPNGSFILQQPAQYRPQYGYQVPPQNGPRHPSSTATPMSSATAAVAQLQNGHQDIRYGSQTYHYQAQNGYPPSSQHHPAGPVQMTPQQQQQQQQRPLAPAPALVPIPSSSIYANIPGGSRSAQNVPNYPAYPAAQVVVRPDESSYQHQYGNSGCTVQRSTTMQQYPQQYQAPQNHNQQHQQQHQLQQTHPQHHLANNYNSSDMTPTSSAYFSAIVASADGRSQHYSQSVPTPVPLRSSHAPVDPTLGETNLSQQSNAAGLVKCQTSTSSRVFSGSAAALLSDQTSPATPATPSVAPMTPSQNEVEEPRLRLQVQNGTILAPFRLQHNAPVSQHPFVLDEKSYEMLMINPDMNLELKCFHVDDASRTNNWPRFANIKITVNGSPVSVKSIDRPIYIKSFCRKDKNTLQVTVRQCCCSHLFSLTIVNRPTVESVIHEITRLRSIPAEQCVEKVKQFFTVPHNGNGVGCDPDIEQTSMTLPLRCPFLMTRIKLPVRGKECRHLQVFDLRTYLEVNQDLSNWKCPVCKRPAVIESLEIDKFVLSILTMLIEVDADEVTMDPCARWQPIINEPSENDENEDKPGPSGKEDPTDVPCSSAKRFKPDSDFRPGSLGPVSSLVSPSTSHFPPSAPGRLDTVFSPFYQPNLSPAALGSVSTAPPSTPLSSLSSFGSPPVLWLAGRPNRTESFNNSITETTHDTTEPVAIQNANIDGDAGQPMNVHDEPTRVDTSRKPSGLDPDFPDFNFDEHDVLGGGDSSHNGATIFKDPESLVKYLREPIEYNTPSQRQDSSSSQTASPAPASRNLLCLDNHKTSSTARSNSTELTSMDKILSLLHSGGGEGGGGN